MQARIVYDTDRSAYVMPLDEPAFTTFSVTLENADPEDIVWPSDADVEAGILQMTEISMTVAVIEESGITRIVQAVS